MLFSYPKVSLNLTRESNLNRSEKKAALVFENTVFSRKKCWTLVLEKI